MNHPKKIRSHFEPNLYLEEHVRQVMSAAQFLFRNHSPEVRDKRSESQKLLEALVRCHDLGKGSPAFQAYIADPGRYKGDPQEKSHTGLSGALSLLWAKQEGLLPLQALNLAQGVVSHHRGFSPLEHLEERLRCDDGDLLTKQWERLDKADLSAACGLDLCNVEGDFEDGRRWLFKRQKIEVKLNELEMSERLKFRLWTQFLFSILLEADKALLALHEEPEAYFRCERKALLPSLVDAYIGTPDQTEINTLRCQARGDVLQALSFYVSGKSDQRIFTVTLPTGVGKTLIAASWALTMREKMAEDGVAPQIIIVLPYLSIIDQTEKVYRKLFGLLERDPVQGDVMLCSHSFCERSYELEGEEKSQNFSDFFIDTWRSNLVITTFDQFLLALFSPKTKHQMRFHHLMDALIIMDEVQTIPCRLWDPIDKALHALTQEGNSRILMMSATQPGLLSGGVELAGRLDHITDLFQRFGRYRLILNHRDPQTLTHFIETSVVERVPEWLDGKKRVLITLNTRSAARAVWKAVEGAVNGEAPVFLISADVTPVDRLMKIEQIKKNDPCFVISTQCIEAGVDIDVDHVIRDFSPLDSLIQIAGRCNREGKKNRCDVEIVRLTSDRGRAFDEMIYDKVHLNETRLTLDTNQEVLEEEILALTQRYFDGLRRHKNLGEATTEAFANWAEMPDIHEELRGEFQKEVHLLVIDQDRTEDCALLEEIRWALDEKDRWKRRSWLRGLAGEIQKRTVTVHVWKHFHHEEFATPLGRGDRVVYFWLLKAGYYTSEGGLDLRLDEEQPSFMIF